LPAAALIAMGFFGYYAVLGPNGAMAHPEVKRQLEVREAEYQKLDRQRAVLKNRVDLLDPAGADPDLVEELARKKLDVVAPGEIVVPLD